MTTRIADAQNFLDVNGLNSIRQDAKSGDKASKKDALEQAAKQFEAISDYKTNLTFESLPYEQKLFTQDTTLRDKRNRWHENLSKDVYVEEALNVLHDLKTSYGIKKVATVKD